MPTTRGTRAALTTTAIRYCLGLFRKTKDPFGPKDPFGVSRPSWPEFAPLQAFSLILADMAFQCFQTIREDLISAGVQSRQSAALHEFVFYFMHVFNRQAFLEFGEEWFEGVRPVVFRGVVEALRTSGLLPPQWQSDEFVSALNARDRDYAECTEVILLWNEDPWIDCLSDSNVPRPRASLNRLIVNLTTSVGTLISPARMLTLVLSAAELESQFIAYLRDCHKAHGRRGRGLTPPRGVAQDRLRAEARGRPPHRLVVPQIQHGLDS